MAFFIFGVQYQNAPIAARERVAIAPEGLAEALRSLCEQPSIEEGVILSTCNRTEIYCEADNIEAIKHWFACYFGVELAAWSQYFSEYSQETAVEHIMRVASGLDSMVLGEPQVLGQIKEAYGIAQQAGTVGKRLSRLFQMAFTAAKAVRSKTKIGEQPTSLAYAAIKLSQHIFQDIKQKRVLLLGAGDMIDLAVKYLVSLEVKTLVFANRTREKAQTLAQANGGSVIGLSDVPKSLAEVDMLITATSSDVPLVGKGSVERAMRARKQKSMVLIDLAVPRDIEPEIKTLDNVYLYDIDSLQSVVAANMEARVKAAKQATSLIEQQIKEYLAWQKELEHLHHVKAFREHQENLRDEALSKAQKAVEAGKPASEVLAELAHTLTNKLLHMPTLHLKQSAKRDTQKS